MYLYMYVQSYLLFSRNNPLHNTRFVFLSYAIFETDATLAIGTTRYDRQHQYSCTLDRINHTLSIQGLLGCYHETYWMIQQVVLEIHFVFQNLEDHSRNANFLFSAAITTWFGIYSKVDQRIRRLASTTKKFGKFLLSLRTMTVGFKIKFAKEVVRNI